MVQEQLNQAYRLIKRGSKEQALELLYPLLDENPDNGDGWWLLANATDDTDAKYYALNRILELGGNYSRLSRVRQMLNSLPPQNAFDDLYQPENSDLDFSTSVRSSSAPRQYELAYEDPYSPQNRNDGKGCRIILGIFAILVFVACIAYSILGIAAMNFAREMAGEFGEVFDVFSAPTEYDDRGVVEYGQVVTGQITGVNDRIGYRINANAGDQIILTIQTSDTQAGVPMVYLYGPDDVYVAGTSESNASSSVISATSTTAVIQTTGEHLIVVRPMMSFGIASYQLSIQRQ